MNKDKYDESTGAGLGRRAFLHGAAAALPLVYAASGSSAATAQVPNSGAQPLNNQQTGLIIRRKEPENLEFPFSTLDSRITPNERFYIRNHFSMPEVDKRAWRLKVEGAVARPFEMSYAELLKMPSRTIMSMLECAGNSRVFHVPKMEGEQWELGAASNAEWTGVSLAAVLERAGVRPGAVEVILEGADEGEVEEIKPAGEIHYARSLPLDKARQPDVLLAYRMNGAELPAAHGFPLRAIVPGWYGMASVKWLTRIVVTDRPFNGYYQTVDYAYWERRDGLPTRVPVTELNVKAEIARPAMHEVVAANAAYRMHGAAWTGESDVVKVEVSADNGRAWATARLLDQPVRHAWRLWEYDWRAPRQPGRYTVMARATDARGRVQAMRHDPDRGHHMFSFVLPIDIEVR